MFMKTTENTAAFEKTLDEAPEVSEDEKQSKGGGRYSQGRRLRETNKRVTSSKPNTKFPRAHLWQWQEPPLDIEAEFERTTNMVLADTEKAAEEGRKKAAAALSAVSPIEEKRPAEIVKTSESNSTRKKKLPFESNLLASMKRSTTKTKSVKESKLNALERRRKSNAQPQRRVRRFSLKADEVLASVAQTRANGDPTDQSSLTEEREKNSREYSNLETPTPPPMIFGLEDEGGEWEEENTEEELHELLLRKREEKEAKATSQQVFLDACFEGHLVPEPLLCSRMQEAKATMEASQMHNNLEIRLKADIEKENCREVAMWDWVHVSKTRTPDELKLEHYSLGDKYMQAIAKGIQIDALHAKSGKRCFQRFNLSSCRISGRGLELFMQGFRNHLKALRLDLSNNQLGPAGITSLSSALLANAPCSNSLTVLDLSGNSLGDRAVQSLFSGLRNSRVQWLNLSKNQIGPVGAMSIERFIVQQRRSQRRERRQSKRYSFLASKGMDPHSPTGEITRADSFFLGSALETPGGGGDTSRQEDGGVEDEQIHHCPLSTLLLDWNQIRGKGAAQLLLSFAGNEVITELSLSWNGFGTHEPSTQALLEMIEKNTALKSLRLAHNLFSASKCEAILRQLFLSKSLLSLDITGNDPHEDIFARGEYKHSLHKLSESWPMQQGNSAGTSLLYTRYVARTCPVQSKACQDTDDTVEQAQQQLPLANRKRKDQRRQEVEEPETSQDAASLEGTASPITGEQDDAGGSEASPIEEPVDAALWKRRNECWLARRWTEQTIWYYPGVSGPPSKEVYIELMLPGGVGMCTKMKLQPHVQKIFAESGLKSQRSIRSANSSSPDVKFHHASTSSAMASRQTTTLFKSKQSTRFGMGAKSTTRRLFPGSGAKQSPSVADGLNKKLDAKIHNSTISSTSNTIFDPLEARKRKLRRNGMRNGVMEETEYDYGRLLDLASKDNSTMLGRAIVNMIKNRPEGDFTERESEMIENLKDLSLSQDEPICPSSVTLMLPPGRIQYKFIVRGEEVFAKDQDTCWTKWPTEREITDQGKVAAPKNAIEVQQRPSVANCLDIKWPVNPVVGLANPDPGSERPTPPLPWTIRKSIFRYHNCDTAKSLREAFLADWNKISVNQLIRKAIGEEIEIIAELMWAHYSQICTIFTILSCSGQNSFALSFNDLMLWIRDKSVVPSTVPEELLFELFDQSVTMETRQATNPFGKHYSFMVKTQATSSDREECNMIRHHFLQYLILLAVRVYAPSSRPSLARAQLMNSMRAGRARGADGALQVKSRSKYGTEAFDAPFDAVHHLMRRILLNHEHEYVHRDVFRRGHLFFQDVVNVFIRKMDFLKAAFDEYAVKGHCLHDFVPLSGWEKLFCNMEADFPTASLQKIFALSKNTCVSFEDIDFAPGLCFLEFLECLARLARLQILAESVVTAFDRKANALSKLNKQIYGLHDDGLALRLEELIDKLQVSITSAS